MLNLHSVCGTEHVLVNHVGIVERVIILTVRVVFVVHVVRLDARFGVVIGQIVLGLLMHDVQIRRGLFELNLVPRVGIFDKIRLVADRFGSAISRWLVLEISRLFEFYLIALKLVLVGRRSRIGTHRGHHVRE